jgi:hypothetical protein
VKFSSLKLLKMLGLSCLLFCTITQDGRINALYSTPSIYTDAKYAANEQWPLKTNDFFPYVFFIHNMVWFVLFCFVLCVHFIMIVFLVPDMQTTQMPIGRVTLQADLP